MSPAPAATTDEQKGAALLRLLAPEPGEREAAHEIYAHGSADGRPTR